MAKFRWKLFSSKRDIMSDKFRVAGEIKASSLKEARKQALEASAKTHRGWHKGKWRITTAGRISDPRTTAQVSLYTDSLYEEVLILEKFK